MTERKGILAGGNWIIDHIKIIDAWPGQDALANILETSKANGGSPYNVLKDLALLGAPFPLEAVGLVGNDADGQYILHECATLGIHVQNLAITSAASTSFTDVMTVKGTGRRTFFHNRGSNDLFSPEHVDFSQSKSKIFHLGYLLLLAGMDELDAKGRTCASYLFEKAQQAGFLTSADVVSESSDRFKAIVAPSLPYLDYLFVNEYEAGKITGLDLCPDGNLDVGLAIQAGQQILNQGVKQQVFLHHPAMVIAIGQNGQVETQASINIPAEQIVGAAGAGDAFAAGVLFGLHEGWSVSRSLELGVCTAASSLYSASCSDGVKSVEEVLRLKNS